MAKLKVAFVLALTSSALHADPLSDMAGTWRGSGWARETPQGPQETVRCKIVNAYAADARTLTISGQCAVPGRRLSIAGSLIGTEGSQAITGRWSNPDGAGSTRITGVKREGIVAFTFKATDPNTGRALAQNVEWRVSRETLRLRSTDRANPDIMMSDIAFTR